LVARTGLTFGEITDALDERSAELASGDGSENTYKMLCYAANELDARLDSSLGLCTENGEDLALSGRQREAARVKREHSDQADMTPRKRKSTAS
jgi:hypothetical protein